MIPNLIGVAGFLLIVLAVGVLAGIWWAVLLAGVVLVLVHVALTAPLHRRPRKARVQ